MFALADVDDTLYPLSSGLSTQCTQNILGTHLNLTTSFSFSSDIGYNSLPFLYSLICICIEYMVQRLGIDAEKAPEMNYFLYKNYGTSMAGLRVQTHYFLFLFSFTLTLLSKYS